MAKQEPWQITDATFVAGAATVASLPPQLLVEIAFAGRSNVGKSSLMNALMGRRRLVRTSATPGCTRQLSFFEATARDGAKQYLVDLPGYGYAKRSKAERAQWADLIETYLTQRDQLRVVCVLADARRGLEDEERSLLQLCAEHRREVVVVATKVDRIAKSKQKAAINKLDPRAVATSAETGHGIDVLWRRLRKLTLGGPMSSEPESPSEPVSPV